MNEAPAATLLLTGFEPFGPWRRNVTREATAALDGEVRAGIRLRAVELPVAWPRAGEVLAAAIRRFEPIAVLSFGIHGDALGAFRVEAVAANELRFPIPDNDGAIREGPVVPGAPAELAATLPIEAIHAALVAAGLRVERSRDAGRYLCNAVYYAVLRSGVLAAFVHVPPRLPDQAWDDVKLAVGVAASAVALAVASGHVVRA